MGINAKPVPERRPTASVSPDRQAGAALAQVLSVNGKTGYVQLSADDVGAMPSGYVAPVTSVAGKTGAVTLTPTDAGLGTSAEINAIANRRGAAIPSNADLDDYYNPGSYYCVSGDVAQSLYHSPVSASNFRLEVISSGTLSLENIVQFLWSSHVSTVYFRRRAGGVWTGWAKMLDAYLPAETDSYTAASGILNGLIIANAKTIYFDLTTSKSMELINSVSVTSLKLAIFGVNGNIASSTTSTEWVGQSGITVSAVKIKNNKLRIALTNTSAFANATGGTPVSAIGTFTLSFA